MSVDDLFPRAPSTPDQVLGPRSARRPVVGPSGYRAPSPSQRGGPPPQGRGALAVTVAAAVLLLGIAGAAIFASGSGTRGTSTGGVGVIEVSLPGVPTPTPIVPVVGGGVTVVEQPAHDSAIILAEHPNVAEARAVAQTFRVPGPGLLLHEAAVFALGRVARINVSVYQVRGAGPAGGTKLRSKTIDVEGFPPGFLTVTFDEPMALRTGRGYALVVTPVGPGELLVARLARNDVYPSGRPWELEPGGWRSMPGELTFRLTFSNGSLESPGVVTAPSP